MNPARLRLALSLLALLVSVGISGVRLQPGPPPLPLLPVIVPPLPLPRPVEQILSPRTTLDEVLRKAGLTPAQVQQIIREVRPVYNLNQVKSGHRLWLERGREGNLRGLRYEIDDESYLEVLLRDGHYRGRRLRHRFQVRVEEFFGRIDTSLWKTLVSQGETDRLVYLLTRVLQWDIDFTSIQPRDSFKLIVEKKYLGNRFVKYGDILAVAFRSGGHTFYGFEFNHPVKGKRYYDERGRPVRKAFLKVPFNFDPRITSTFSYSRYHPILKRRRPHLGVDYGAPIGTPVLAAGSGTVIFSGWRGGFGKLVRVRHPNGYTTSYAHLSRIEVRPGQKVRQGQRIGRVGATGLATGPHLDYRVINRRGRYINPRTVSALPSDRPLAGRLLKRFAAVRDRWMRRLDAIPEIGPFLKRAALAD